MKKVFANVIRNILKCMDDVLMVIGIAFLSYGAFLIFYPAGFIILGICFVAFAFFIAKEGGF